MDIGAHLVQTYATCLFFARFNPICVPMLIFYFTFSVILIIVYYFIRCVFCLLSLVFFVLWGTQVEAAKYDLNYIGLSGNIGCMGMLRYS